MSSKPKKQKKRTRSRKKVSIEIEPPLLSADPPELTDYLELRAHMAELQRCSSSELRSDLGMGGSGDAIEDTDDSGETEEQKTEGLIEATFAEAEDRIRACGTHGYPFELKGNILVSHDNDSRSVYTFLLLLSKFGEGAVENLDGAKLFEDVCARAAADYLKCSDAEHYVFGFPRRVTERGFSDAVLSLCERLREGEADTKFPRVEVMKDAGLDIVAWREFPDSRASKLIAFGQCATGKDWWGKRRDLNTESWCGTWLLKRFLIHPLKMFFVPHAVPRNRWHQLGYDAGLVFDRFRIAYHAQTGLSRLTTDRLQEWNTQVKARLK